MFFGCEKNRTPPNVILIITDDQGYGDLNFNGNPNIITPALDNFAAESVRFNNFYVTTNYKHQVINNHFKKYKTKRAPILILWGPLAQKEATNYSS